MKRVCEKECYLFKVKEDKYGLIQVVKKSRSGFLVRVFDKLFTDQSMQEVDNCVNGNAFYYINNFTEFELLNKSYKCLGKYKIPSFVSAPRFTRKSERKQNGKLIWYIFDEKKRQVVESFDKFDEKLKELSPEANWGITYITKRWEEGFSLGKWNDDLENKWYYRYLVQYEPEKLKKIKMTTADLQAATPTRSWAIDSNESANVLQIEACLGEFLASVTKESVNDCVSALINKINDINKQKEIIDTVRAEDLVQYVCFVCRCKNLDFDQEILDTKREW